MDNNDSLWALVVPTIVVALMRLVDALVPKGYMFKIVRKWMVEIDDDDDDDRDDKDDQQRPLTREPP